MYKKEIDLSKVPTYHKHYIDCADDLPLLKALEFNRLQTLSFFENLSEDTMNSAYAKDKWSIKELLQHLIDTERIFSYRAMRFARNDQTPLPGYEQDDYVPYSEANSQSKAALLTDFNNVRNATISLFQSFSEEILLKKGIASGETTSVLAIGFINVGHVNHHLNIVKERYL